jgi:hypothetical protein
MSNLYSTRVIGYRILRRRVFGVWCRFGRVETGFAVLHLTVDNERPIDSANKINCGLKANCHCFYRVTKCDHV